MICPCVKVLRAFFAAAIFSAVAFASDITGTVTNKTTNEPSAGDDVILLKLAQGMQEVARTKTDARGAFKLSSPSDGRDQGSNGIGYLIRVNHRNVNYHKPAPPGAGSVEIDVYDSAEKLEGINESVDIMRVEADATNVRIIEMFAVTNSSKPPRTLMGPKSFEIALPDGAQIEQSLAAGPGGMPINSTPTPTGEKNHYSFLFPLRPGETRFQVAYTMPYSGKARIQPILVRPAESFAVSVPKSMQMTPERDSRLEAKGEEAGMAVYVAQNARPGQPLGFTISGTGSTPLDSNKSEDTAADSSSNRPGGGLGAPTNTPDPLYKYRWWLIGTVAIMLVGGAAFTMSRPAATQVSGTPATHASPATAGNLIINALKEELFSLESERLEQKISAQEYASAKAALDLLIKRALTKKGL